MSASVAEQVIERSAQDVWAYAADIVRHAEWMTVTDARIVQGDGTQVGARGRERVRFGPFGWDAEFEVSEAEPGRRLAWKSVQGVPFDLTVTLDLEPIGPASTKAMLRGGHPTARPVASAVADGRDGGKCRAGARTLAAQGAGRVGSGHDSGDVMTSLTEFPISARAAAGDLDRARRWYEDRLGLLPEHEDAGGAWYRFAGETWLYLYATPSAGTAKNTIAGWEVKDIETVMAELRERGVIFEEFDLGDVRMVDGLADFGMAKAAWFKDSEGNTYELTEVRQHP